MPVTPSSSLFPGHCCVRSLVPCVLPFTTFACIIYVYGCACATSQLMCKQLSIDVKDLTPGRLLYARKRPVLAGNPDFNVKVPEPVVPGIAAVTEPTEASGPVDLNALPPLVIPKMATLSRVPALVVFERVPLLKVCLSAGCSSCGSIIVMFSTAWFPLPAVSAGI
jgi:hypothetical protein